MVALRLALAPDDDVRTLVTELEDLLSRSYPPEQRHGLSVEALFLPHVRFYVASIAGQAIGCGGVALFDAFAEIKRMYVRPAARGRGVARALLVRLEADAREAGRPLLRLETGTEQLDALRLYRAQGFADCSAFPPYSSLPAHTIATSVFMEKRV
jgi:putative acetyltransferase